LEPYFEEFGNFAMVFLRKLNVLCIQCILILIGEYEFYPNKEFVTRSCFGDINGHEATNC
jgi:hypothetical protein